MRSQYLGGSYAPHSSILNSLDGRLKISLLVLYVAAVIAVRDPPVLTCLALVIVSSGRRSLRAWVSLFVTALVLALWLIDSVEAVQGVMAALLKLALIGALLRLYSENSRPQELAQMFHGMSRRRLGREMLYFFSTMLTALPLIQRDLSRALDAERLRLGHLPHPWMIFTWVNVLINIQVRALERASESSQSAIERGFDLGSPMTLDVPEKIGWNGLAKTIALALPAALLVGTDLALAYLL